MVPGHQQQSPAPGKHGEVGDVPTNDGDTGACRECEPNDDTRHPGRWSRSKRWQVTLIACYVTAIVGINATSITAASREINIRFNVSDASFPHSFWPVTAWNTGAAIAPMLIIPLLEKYGMRLGYLASYVLFFLFVIPQAVARNFATLIVCRFIAGCFAGVLQDVMDAIIADVWPDATSRSLPVTYYVTSLLLGVTIGPVFGGAVTSRLDWRWMFYIQLILYGISFPFVWVCFKETRPLAAAALQGLQDDPKLEDDLDTSGSASTKRLLYDALVRPSYLLVTEPVVFFFTLLSALSYGIVFVSTQSVTQVFTELYGWQEWQAGLVQASLAIGELVGFAACLVQNKIFAQRVRADKGKPAIESSVPESRLYLSVPGSFVGLTAGLFMYGWAAYPALHWTVPSIGLGLVGFGSVTVMQAIMIYITDSYDQYAGSASAAVCFGENMFAAFLPLSASSMYTNLGFHWASSLLAFVALALSFAPVALLLKGRQIRKRSPFMCKASASTI